MKQRKNVYYYINYCTKYKQKNLLGNAFLSRLNKICCANLLSYKLSAETN
jgi:hypothetical protein